MDLNYLQNCPSCGAPVELAEADRLVSCSYCDGLNYLVNSGPLRFILPHEAPERQGEENLIYLPYLRFKGHIYTCSGKELSHDIVDTTQLGYNDARLPASLGLRPQAMKIRLYGPEHRGRFIKLTEKVVDVFSKAAQLTDSVSSKNSQLYHRSFIGETISFIYLPTYLKSTTLVDGVLNRPMCRRMSRDLLSHTTVATQKWLPRFLPAICPHCGAALQAAKDSLVLSCSNCQTLWEEENGTFVKVDFTVIDGGRTKTYLPFWCVTPETEGIQLNTFGDLIQLTNQPVSSHQKDSEKHLSFWIPAFKIRPKHFLRLAKNLTLSQHKLVAQEQHIHKKMFPVTLPAQEAGQALKAALTAMVLNTKHFIPQLPHLKMTPQRYRLVYLPFHSLGQDLVQDHTSVAISRKILYFGRTM